MSSNKRTRNLNRSPSPQSRKRSAQDKIGDVLRPSPFQLRALWDLDNQCAHEYMGMPLRTCSSIEPPDGPGAVCLSEAMMKCVKGKIRDMWRQMGTLLEIFHDDDQPQLGYRLRVKEDLPLKISMKTTDQVILGWKAVFSDSSESQHLYLRSDMTEHNQYLGGPVSYCNWAPPKHVNILVNQVSHGSAKFLVRAESKPLCAGSELFWDYGGKKKLEFSEESWFQSKCCSINASVTTNASKKPCNSKKTTMEVFKELCVLCGKPYKANRRTWTERKVIKKVHFLNSHANFLGTDWDGCGDYDTTAHSVDYKRALIEAERLSFFLKRLESDSWKPVPACSVMSKQELETMNDDTVMKIFAMRSRRLKKLGSLVVRGNCTASTVEHLHPVKPSPWNEIFPRGAVPTRKYALCEEERDVLTPGIHNDALQDVLMVLNMEDETEQDE